MDVFLVLVRKSLQGGGEILCELSIAMLLKKDRGTGRGSCTEEQQSLPPLHHSIITRSHSHHMQPMWVHLWEDQDLQSV